MVVQKFQLLFWLILGFSDSYRDFHIIHVILYLKLFDLCLDISVAFSPIKSPAVH